ncbi:hypothetical protein WJX77_001208 [Trebouxia sp. C0004]
MSCLVTCDQWLCGVKPPYRHRHVWLRSCRSNTAARNSSTNNTKVSQLQKVPGVYCAATAAQPQKQQGKI